MKKKLAAAAAALLIAAAMTGCGNNSEDTSSETSSVSVSDAASDENGNAGTAETGDISQPVNDIIAQIEMSSLAEVGSDRLSMYLDTDIDKIDAFSMYICGSGGFADEVGIFRMKSADDCSALVDLINDRIEKRKTDFEDYNPDEAEKLGNSVVGSKDNYVYYAVTPDSSKAEQIFKDFIG